MGPDDSRDLDGVIDSVARAMTSGRLERDLRPVVAARLRRPSWPLGWRVAAASAMSVMVVAVALMSRSGGEPQQTPSIAGPPAVATGHEPRRVLSQPATAVARTKSTKSARGLRSSRPAARVARQTIVRTSGTEDVVVIAPMAIVPLEGDDVSMTASAASRVVTITPIDVEPVRIREFGEQVE